MQILRMKAVGFVSALALSSVLGCSQSDEDLDPTTGEIAEVSAQWVDEVAPPPAAPANPTRPDTQCGGRLLPGQERTCRFGNRNYIIRAGATMDASKPVPLVIDLPSTTTTPPEQLGKERFCWTTLCWSSIGSGWAAESDTPGGGFIVVVPERNNGLLTDEVAYVRNLVNEIRRQADVDLSKVYLSGASDGGGLALDVGCGNANVFSGIAPNSGSNMSCRNLRRPIPAISFSSPADVLTYNINYNAAESLARANGCRGGAKEWRVFDRTSRDAVCRTANGDPKARLIPCADVTSARIEPTRCKAWTECSEGADVVFCDVAAANPHGYINAQADAHVLYENATLLNTPSVAWRFFKQFWAR